MALTWTSCVLWLEAVTWESFQQVASKVQPVRLKSDTDRDSPGAAAESQTGNQEMHKPLSVGGRRAGLPRSQSTMGNQLCCGGSWSCTSTLQRKKKIGSRARGTLRLQQQQPQLERWRQLNDTEDTMGHLYEQVLPQPASQQRSRQSLRSEDSGLYYADIQLYSLPQPRSVQEVKHLQLKNATEYATLRFPQVTPRYDSKNGTLV